MVRSQTLGADEPGVLVVCRCAELDDTHGKVLRLVENVAILAFVFGGEEVQAAMKTSVEANCLAVSSATVVAKSSTR